MNNKKLFTTKSTMTPDRYGEMISSFPFSIFGSLFLLDIFFIIILYIFNKLIFNVPFYINLLFIVVFNIFTSIYLSINISNISKNNYIKKMNRLKLPLENESEIDFYEDYLVSKGRPAIVELYYREINKAVEVEDYFYFKCSKYNSNILVEKKNCSKELIDFIRNKFFIKVIL